MVRSEVITIGNGFIPLDKTDYYEIFNNIHDAIFIHDLKSGRIVDVNQRMLDMYGFKDKKKVVGHFVEGISSSKGKFTKENAFFMIQKAVKEGICRFDWEARDSKKRAFPVNVTLKRISLNGYAYILAIVRDISKEKKVLNELEERERLLGIIERHSNEMFYVHDKKHVLNYVSPYSKTLLGYTPDEMKIKWTKLATKNPINREGLVKTERALKTGNREGIYNLELRRKDGSIAVIEIDESPFYGKDNKVAGIVGAARDITKRYREEAEILEKKHELEMFSRCTVGREVKMAELKGEIESLKKKLARRK